MSLLKRLIIVYIRLISDVIKDIVDRINILSSKNYSKGKMKNYLLYRYLPASISDPDMSHSSTVESHELRHDDVLFFFTKEQLLDNLDL